MFPATDTMTEEATTESAGAEAQAMTEEATNESVGAEGVVIESTAPEEATPKGATTLFDLELIKERKLSDQDRAILDALSGGPNTTPWDIAYQLDWLCPLLEEKKEAEYYFWRLWGIIADIARSPGVTDEIQEYLVLILRSLERQAKGDIIVWGVSTITTIPITGNTLTISTETTDRETCMGRLTSLPAVHGIVLSRYVFYVLRVLF